MIQSSNNIDILDKEEKVKKVSMEHVKIEGEEFYKEVEKIESHIEWNDYIDILGHWTYKPDWKEIIQKYRKQNLDLIINENNIILEKDEN